MAYISFSFCFAYQNRTLFQLYFHYIFKIISEVIIQIINIFDGKLTLIVVKTSLVIWKFHINHLWNLFYHINEKCEWD